MRVMSHTPSRCIVRMQGCSLRMSVVHSQGLKDFFSGLKVCVGHSGLWGLDVRARIIRLRFGVRIVDSRFQIEGRWQVWG